MDLVSLEDDLLSLLTNDSSPVLSGIVAAPEYKTRVMVHWIAALFSEN